MTDAALSTRLLLLMASLAALLGAVYGMLLPTLIDEFRQDMFEVRHRLFMVMARGRIEPGARAYTVLRTSMNAVMRFAERVSLVRSLIAMAVVDVNAFRNDLERTLADIEDAALRTEMMAIRDEFTACIGRHLTRTSPIIWVLVAVAWVSSHVLHVSGWLVRFVGRMSGGIEAGAKVEEFAA